MVLSRCKPFIQKLFIVHMYKLYRANERGLIRPWPRNFIQRSLQTLWLKALWGLSMSQVGPREENTCMIKTRICYIILLWPRMLVQDHLTSLTQKHSVDELLSQIGPKGERIYSRQLILDGWTYTSLYVARRVEP